MPRPRIIIALSNPTLRNRLAKAIAALPEVEVIATAADLSETFTLAEAEAPDLVIIGSEFCKYDEFGAMKTLFNAVKARWVELVQDHRIQGNFVHSFGSGRPETDPLIDMAMDKAALRFQLKLALTTERVGAGGTAAPPSMAPLKWARAVLIGASTGGVDALLTLLSDFPADCPPTAIVQHTGQGFSDSLVRLLDRRCRPHVLAAEDGMVMSPGRICVAAGTEGHLHLIPGPPMRCGIRPGRPTSGHMPSVDDLFRSALPMAQSIVAVILTGMGQDGAAGLLDLRRGGAVTLGQDQASSVVYGMPKAAWDLGAVRAQHPIQRLGSAVLRAALIDPAPPATGRAAASRAVWG